MDELKAKIARLKVRYEGGHAMPPSDVLDMLEELRQAVVNGQVVWAAVEKLEHRIVALEKTQPSYQPPRGA